jgi:hypothetical protein
MNDMTSTLLAYYVLLWIVFDASSFNPTDQQADEIIWIRIAIGEYTARSAYQLQL